MLQLASISFTFIANSICLRHGHINLAHARPHNTMHFTSYYVLLGSQGLHITEQPASQEVVLGSSLTLSCQASGPADVSYLWFLNGLSLPDATSSNYHIASMTEDDEGMYCCEVSSQSCSLMSQMAQISLKT